MENANASAHPLYSVCPERKCFCLGIAFLVTTRPTWRRDQDGLGRMQRLHADSKNPGADPVPSSPSLA